MSERPPLFPMVILPVILSAAIPPAGLAQTGTLVVVNKAASTASIIDLASGETVATLATGTGRGHRLRRPFPQQHAHGH